MLHWTFFADFLNLDARNCRLVGGGDIAHRKAVLSLAHDRQTLAVYMAVKHFPDLMNTLIAHGRRAETPVAIIQKGTTPGQWVIRGSLGQLVLLAEANQVFAPAILIIGEVARVGQENKQ